MKKNKALDWTTNMQQALNKMHLVTDADALLAHLDHNKQFDIYTDSSDIKWVIVSGKMVTQLSVTAKGLIVLNRITLPLRKKFVYCCSSQRVLINVAHSHNIHIYTNHKNFTFDDLNTQCVLHWQNKNEELLS